MIAYHYMLIHVICTVPSGLLLIYRRLPKPFLGFKSVVSVKSAMGFAKDFPDPKQTGQEEENNPFIPGYSRCFDDIPHSNRHVCLDTICIYMPSIHI